MDEGRAVVLHRRPLYVAGNLTWGVTSAGLILTVGRRLLLGTLLGRSAIGIWGIWVILALAVAGVAAAMHWKLRPVGVSLSD